MRSPDTPVLHGNMTNTLAKPSIETTPADTGNLLRIARGQTANSAPTGWNKCDSCSSSGTSRIDLTGGCLYFCGHHLRENFDGLDRVVVSGWLDISTLWWHPSLKTEADKLRHNRHLGSENS